MDLALPLYEETLRLTRGRMGPSHPDTLACMNNLAVSYQYAGQPERAVPLLEETLGRMKAELAEGHPDTLAGMNNLAAAYRQAGRMDRAVPLYEEVLKLMRARHGSSHPGTLTCMNNLSAAYRASGDPERSLALFREATAPLEKIGVEAQYADRIVHNLIGTMELLGRLDEAESWRRKWLAVAKQRSGADSIPYADELQALGGHLLRRERWSDA